MRQAGGAGLPANIGRSIRVALATVTALTALGLLTSTASGKPGEALIGVYAENTGWTPAESWPPQRESLAAIPPVWWTTLVEKSDAAPNGGAAASGMSVEQIGALSGIPREYVTGLDVKNGEGEHFHLSRSEALGGTGRAPYLYAEGTEAAKSAVSFAIPEGDEHPGRISTESVGELELVFQIEGGLLQLAPLDVSPAEPLAGEAVDFGEPRVEGNVLGNSPHRYRWTFGDGTTSNEPAPQHVYPNVKSPSTDYEASVELILTGPQGEEVSAGMEVVTVPVKSMAQAPPEPATGTGATGPAATAPGVQPQGTPAPTTSHEETRTTVQRARPSSHGEGAGEQGPNTRAGGHGGKGGAGGHGGTPGAGGSKSAETTAGPVRSSTGPSQAGAGPVGGGKGRPATNAHGTTPAQNHATTVAEGRAPRPLEKPAPAIPRPQAGLMGVLLESIGQALPAATVAAATPSLAARALRSVPRSEASVSTVGALGLATGILAVVLTILWGAVSEVRMGRFVR